ncbi:MAG: hypothetical protein IKJ45_15565 [Kiritimatiellae bacterium]|nr:hypothetical protein [Kiritimatiellia bacterium]
MEIEIGYWQHSPNGNISATTHPAGRFRSADRRQSGSHSRSYHTDFMPILYHFFVYSMYFAIKCFMSVSTPSIPSVPSWRIIASRLDSSAGCPINGKTMQAESAQKHQNTPKPIDKGMPIVMPPPTK